MSPEFRAGERVVSVKLCCTECGRRAEGNHSWTDGSGEICDACVEADEARQIARVTAHDPCVILGCVHEYGHDGQHELGAS